MRPRAREADAPHGGGGRWPRLLPANQCAGTGRTPGARGQRQRQRSRQRRNLKMETQREETMTTIEKRAAQLQEQEPTLGREQATQKVVVAARGLYAEN